LVLSEIAIVNIQTDEKYDAELQRTIKWNDKILAIDWPLYENYPIVISPILSERDKLGLNFIDTDYYE